MSQFETCNLFSSAELDFDCFPPNPFSALICARPDEGTNANRRLRKDDQFFSRTSQVLFCLTFDVSFFVRQLSGFDSLIPPKSQKRNIILMSSKKRRKVLFWVFSSKKKKSKMFQKNSVIGLEFLEIKCFLSTKLTFFEVRKFQLT